MFEAQDQPYLLVASPQLQDPNFEKSVVLMVEHSDDHAMGFIINRPAGIPLRRIIDLPQRHIPEEISSWYGGPVGLDSGVVLHNSEGNAKPNERLIADRIRISGKPEYIEQLVQSAEERLNWLRSNSNSGKPPGCLYPFRFLVGYAGWARQQLNEEIRQGAWMTLALNHTSIFDTPWDKMWEISLQKMGFHPSKWVSTPQSYLN